MSEIKDILAFYDQASLNNQRCALATVIKTEGPSYRSPGARSLICDDGKFGGGLSAGCLEADVGCRLDHSRMPFFVEYDLSVADDVRGFPFGCGGKVEIFVEPLPNERALNAVRWFSNLNEPAVMLTVIRSVGETVEIGWRFGINASATERFDGNLRFAGAEQLCLAALADRRTRIVEVDLETHTITVFVEYFEPAILLFVYGDAEDARVLASFASDVGMNVQRVSRNDIRTNSSLADQFPRIGHAYNVVMTHDLNLDTDVIRQLLRAKPPYLGILGPRSRTDGILHDLDERTRALINSTNLYSPAGLNMGAETPREIALSVLAEIQTLASGRSPGHLRDFSGAIHARASMIETRHALTEADSVSPPGL